MRIRYILVKRLFMGYFYLFFLHFCKGFGANRTQETFRFMEKLISKVALNQAVFQLPFKGHDSYFKAFSL